MRTPLILALMLASASPVLGVGSKPRSEPPGAVRSLPGIAPGTDVEPVPVAEETGKFLASIGWKVNNDGSLVRAAGADKGRVALSVIESGGLRSVDGSLAFADSPYPLEKDKIAAYLEGLANFTLAASMDPAVVGAALAGWGLPPSHDGAQLLNPDGSAAYVGLMLYQHFVARPDALKRLSSQRLSQSIALFDSGYDYTFDKAAAHTGHADVKRAWSLLDLPPRRGETLLALRPYPDLGKTLAKYKSRLELSLDETKDSADPVVQEHRRLDAQALATLNALDKQRYGRPLPKSEPPPDPAAAQNEERPNEPEPHVSLSAGLPGLLKVLDRVNGKPLTAGQLESLIRSFPMGDMVWRTGVWKLWKEGLTGKGVKVAVIDEGVGSHPELDAAVKSRQKFGDYPGKDMTGSHGMHVSGILHQMAPEAEIRSYAVLPGGRDPRFENENADDGVIISAIRKAVADGNTIINMSLGGGFGGRDNPVAGVVEEYARQGIIFAISAGNNRDAGIATPSIAPGALTVGSLDADGRMSDFSQTGTVYDPKRTKYAVKSVFMAPGSNINSTVTDPKGAPGYGVMSGTSMSAPAVSGLIALFQQAVSFNPVPDPVTASRRIIDAMTSTSETMSLSSLPTVPLDQDFLLIDPAAALRKLNASRDPAAKR